MHLLRILFSFIFILFSNKVQEAPLYIEWHQMSQETKRFGGRPTIQPPEEETGSYNLEGIPPETTRFSPVM